MGQYADELMEGLIDGSMNEDGTYNEFPTDSKTVRESKQDRIDSLQHY